MPGSLFDETVLRRARLAGMLDALHNLVTRIDVEASGLDGATLWSALKQSGGLVNAAKRLLMEGMGAQERASPADETPPAKRTPWARGCRGSGRGRGRGRGRGSSAGRGIVRQEPPAFPAVKRSPGEAAEAAEPATAAEAAPVATPDKRRRRDAAGAAIEEAATTTTALAATPSPSAAPARARGAADAPATEPPMKRARASTATEPFFSPAVMRSARRAGLVSELYNLAERSEIRAKGLDGETLIAALRQHGGLVNVAKKALLANC